MNGNIAAAVARGGGRLHRARPTVRLGTILLGAALLGAVVVVTVLTSTLAAPPAKTDLVGVFGAENVEFPDPAFLVNGEPVSGQALARSVAVFEYQARQLGQAIDHRTAVKQAVERLATQVRLAQIARERGHRVTEAELDAYLSELVAEAERFPDAGNAALLAAGGYASWEAYVADPAVRLEYENALLVNKLIEELLAARPGLTAEDLQAFALADAKIELRFAP